MTSRPATNGLARCKCCGVDPKSGRTSACRALQQFAGDHPVSAEGRKVPGDAQQVSPMAVSDEQFGQCDFRSASKRHIKGADPRRGQFLR
jgi:hypothetical protein